VYFDGKLTPDYVSLSEGSRPYNGWITGSCATIGVDRRANLFAANPAQPLQIQKLYATWNASLLGLTWSGADWAMNGDLFVYLSGPGSSTSTGLDAFATGSSPQLPAASNWLVWVKDRSTAALYQWNGSAWAVDNSGALGYAFDTSTGEYLTHLTVPLAKLGVASFPSNLGLFAMATDEGSPRAWATMPARNAATSPLVVGAASDARSASPFGAPLRAYTLNLNNGLCPADGRVDADLLGTLTSTPAGIHVSREVDGWAAFEGNLSQVVNGQNLSYDLAIVNRGTVTATGVSLVLTGTQLSLAGGAPAGSFVWTRTIAISDLAPGAGTTSSFAGTVAYNTAATTPTAISASSAITAAARVAASIHYD
jgi:hypothetical protein